jgi:GT2 family glycosyltransferase
MTSQERTGSGSAEGAAEGASGDIGPAGRGPPADRPEVSVLIVAFRSKAFILDCIQSIYANTMRTSLEILLIDNSNDGAVARIAEHAPMVRVLPNGENLGFARGNNRLAAAARADRLLLLNPDTFLCDDAIDRLTDFSRSRPHAGAWGGITVTPEGDYDAGNRLVFPSLGRLARWALGDGDALSEGGLPAGAVEPAPVEVLSGSFMMVRRDVWNSLGGFDESYFLYSEEVDFFLRLKRLGLEAWATPDAVVVHDVGSGDRHSPQRLLYRVTGQAHFVRKHWSWPKASAAAGLIWVGVAWRWLAAAILSALPRDRARWRTRRRGYAGLLRHPGQWWRGYLR